MKNFVLHHRNSEVYNSGLTLGDCWQDIIRRSEHNTYTRKRTKIHLNHV